MSILGAMQNHIVFKYMHPNKQSNRIRVVYMRCEHVQSEAYKVASHNLMNAYTK